MKQQNTLVIILLAFVLALQLVSLKYTKKSLPSNNVELLFVQEADSGTFKKDGEEFKLTLNNIEANTLWFSDRPHRLAGNLSTEDFVQEWNTGKDSFKTDPPNAAVKVEGSEAAAVLELSNPEYNADTKTLSYDAMIVNEQHPEFSQLSVNAGSELPASFEGATLFIDSSAGAHLCLAGLCISGGASVN